MAYVDWAMQGWEFANCNCNVGCPCQFNQLPSLGHCRAHTFVQIEKGHYGKIKLDGLRWGILGKWPGPIHEGGGTWMSVIDARADAEQRKALEAISHGKDTEPGKLIWQVFNTLVVKYLPTQFVDIELEGDFDAGTAKLRVPGLIDSTSEPIRNPVTGLPHPAKVVLGSGFEYEEADFTVGHARTQGEIDLDFDGTHAHLARVHWSTNGLVRN